MYYLGQIDISGQAQGFGQTILDNSQNIQQGLDNLWNAVQAGGTYQGLCWAAAHVAVLTLIFWAFDWYKKSMEHGFSWEHVTHFIWPMLVMFLLVTSPGQITGERLWGFTLSIRNFINKTNEIVLTSVACSADNPGNCANLADATRIAQVTQATEAQLKAGSTLCLGIPDPDRRKTCMDNLLAQVNGTIQTASTVAGAVSNPWLTGIQAAATQIYNTVVNPQNPAPNLLVDAAVSLANAYENAVTFVLKGIVIALGIAFSYLLQLSLLLTAMLGPIALGASLLPLPTKPVFAWLTAMFSLGIAQISFSIVTGLMSDVMLNAPPADSMPYIIFTGLLSPILALTLATGGGIATFSGLTATVAAATGSIAGLALGGGRSPAPAPAPAPSSP